LINAADTKAAAAEAQSQACSAELQEKRAILEAQAKRAEQRTETITALIPKVMSKTASDAEIGRLANAVYELPSHSVLLPSIPPDALLRRYRHRSGDQVSAYVLVGDSSMGNGHSTRTLLQRDELSRVIGPGLMVVEASEYYLASS
jgi:hypothetical protein